MTVRNDVIERTSVVTYALLEELHEVLAETAMADPGDAGRFGGILRPVPADDLSLGMIMGLTMFLDEHIGPMRSKRLLDQAPTIVLKTDAHVTPALRNRFLPVLRAFAGHLAALNPVPEAGCGETP